MKKDDKAMGEAWQSTMGWAAALAVFSALCDAADAWANYQFGLALGGSAPLIFVIAAAGYTISLGAIGHNGFSLRKPGDWVIGAIFVSCLAATIMGSIFTNLARYGEQIHSSARSDEIERRAKEAANAAQAALERAQKSKEEADEAAAAFVGAPALADVEAARAQQFKLAQAFVADAESRGLEKKPFEESCAKIHRCREAVKKLAATDGDLQRARGAEVARSMARQRQADLDARRQEAKDAANALAKAQEGQRSAIAAMSEMSGGQAGSYALVGSVLMVAVTVIGALAALPSGMLLRRAMDARRAQNAARKPTPKGSASMGSERRQERPKRPKKPTGEAGCEAQNGPHVVSLKARKAQASAAKGAQVSFVAQLIASSTAPVKDAALIRALDSQFGTSRSTAQRIIKEAREAQAQKAQEQKAHTA